MERLSGFWQALTSDMGRRMDEAAWRDATLEQVDPMAIEALETVLRTYVEPFAQAHPSVLVIGFGYRIEELIAIDHVLHPRQVVASEPSVRGHIGFPKWRKYLKSQAYKEQARLNSIIVPTKNPFEKIDGDFDIMFAFVLDKWLQSEGQITKILTKSSDLVVVTGHKTGIYDDGTTDALMIEQSIKKQSGVTVLHSMQHLDLPRSELPTTNDGFIWVLKKL